MKKLDAALRLARKGFHVFPVIEGSKLPAIGAFPTEATRDEEKIKKWWKIRNYNIGISTSKFGDNKALVAVDVDNKGKKKGDEEVLKLEIAGNDFPATFTQITPTGGKHLVYLSDSPVKQGTNTLAPGIDIRGQGGYIVGAGSEVDGKPYCDDNHVIAKAPKWIIDKCSAPNERSPISRTKIDVDNKRAFERAISYLKTAPLALQGEGGDEKTFQVAATIKDFGIDPIDCLDLLFTHWNPKCQPPWGSEELATKVANAYRYGLNPQGANSPEADFGPVISLTQPDPTASCSPLEGLNKEYLFISKTSEVLWETTDFKNEKTLMHFSIPQFHNHLLSKGFIDGNGKFQQLSNAWMRSPARRSFVDTCFSPGRNPPAQFYNLWKGFTVEEYGPKEVVPEVAKKALADLIDHVRENICEEDPKLADWFWTYFAHLVQKPQVKPSTAIVMKGKKGTGKNVVIDCVNRLLGRYATIVSNKRYLTSNFNAHLESLLLFTLDEAFWSGDKQSEGILKDLISGRQHIIERKGQEAYKVDNITRVVIIGNEEWVVPASQDERRFAVFNVGEKRKQDVEFFQGIMDGMELGGDRLLLKFLREFDISKINVNIAPQTAGLLEQKQSSLDPFYQWWLEILEGGAFNGEAWPYRIECATLRDSYFRYMKERNIKSRYLDESSIGRMLKSVMPSIERKRSRTGGDNIFFTRVYLLPNLDTARENWDTYIGHKRDWK